MGRKDGRVSERTFSHFYCGHRSTEHYQQWHRGQIRVLKDTRFAWDIHDNEGKTDSHNSFKCARLSSRVPLETVESVIVPEMLCEETQELYVRSGVDVSGVNRRFGGGYPDDDYAQLWLK